MTKTTRNRGSDVRESVHWFYQHLSLQLDDQKLENDGIKVEFYFDSADVRETVLGLQAFLQPNLTFDDAGFYSKRALVWALASAGLFGHIRMLSPHQAEFLNHLSLNFGVGREIQDPKGLVRAFFQEVSRSSRLSKRPPSKEMSQRMLLNFVRKNAKSAETLYKVLQAISFGANWQTRLARMLKEGTLEIKDSRVDYSNLIQSKDFLKLKQVFDRLRGPGRSLNNFADAAALTILISKLDAFSQGATSSIPRFYSNPTFDRVVAEADIHDRFISHLSTSSHFESLQTRDYFIFKAIFISGLDNGGITGEAPYYDTIEELEELRDQLSDILESQEHLTETDLKHVQISGRPLGKVIHELRDLTFFENIWLHVKAEDEVRKRLSEMGDLAIQLQSPEFEAGVEVAIKSAKKTLHRNVDEYNLIRRIFSGLEKAIPVFQKRYGHSSSDPLDVFQSHLLLRFGFPETTHSEIRRIWGALSSGDDVLSEGDSLAKDAVRSLLVLSSEGKTRPLKHQDSLVVVSAILWALRMRTTLVQLLGSIRYLPHYSLKVVYAASLLKSGRTGRNLGRVRRIVRELNKEYRLEADAETRGHIASGLGYLLYHLAECLGHKSHWSFSKSARKKRTQSPEVNATLEESIEYAKKAYRDLAASPVKQAYSLNQLLLYLVELNDIDRIDEIEEAAAELSGLKDQEDLWAYTYDDTLARFFLRCAIWIDVREVRTSMLDTALAHSKDAVEYGVDDQMVKSFRATLHVALTSHEKTKE